MIDEDKAEGLAEIGSNIIQARSHITKACDWAVKLNNEELFQKLAEARGKLTELLVACLEVDK